jgi:hypothetical protein
VYPPNMDTNTMIVHLVSTLALFALLVLVVLRLDVLWLRLRHFELDLSGWIKASMRFYKEDAHRVMMPRRSRWPQGSYRMVSDVRAMLGDQCDIDYMVITHPDRDHWDVLQIPHHCSRIKH